jgi:hypothetical protein
MVFSGIRLAELSLSSVISAGNSNVDKLHNKENKLRNMYLKVTVQFLELRAGFIRR